MKIIHTRDSVTIGLISCPKNSISPRIVNKVEVAIFVLGLSAPIVDKWENFTNEYDEKYSSIDAVIDDLKRNHTGDLYGNDQIIVDEISDLVTYIGYAKPGALTSDAKWAILKITSSATSAPSTTIFEWATAFKDRSNIWDDRLSLTYVS